MAFNGIGSQVDSTTIAAFSLAASARTPSIDTLMYPTAVIQLEMTGITGTATGCTIQAQGSNDGVNWFNAGTAYTIAATGTVHGSIEPSTVGGLFNWRFLSLNYTVGNLTGGALTAWVCLKRAN